VEVQYEISVLVGSRIHRAHHSEAVCEGLVSQGPNAQP
jgi:hypothetical protein